MCVKAEGDSVSSADGDAMTLDKKDAASDSLLTRAHTHTYTCVRKHREQNDLFRARLLLFLMPQ